MTKAVVFAETPDAYAELIGGARDLADELTAIVVGSEQDAATVAAYGVAVRLIPRDDSLLLDDHWPLVVDQITELAPELVLLAATLRVRALAGQLAVRTGHPVASDVTSLTGQGPGYAFRTVRYGGATQQDGTAAALIVLTGSGMFTPAEPSSDGPVSVIAAAAQSGLVKLLSRTPRSEETVDLSAAEIVVGVGRGISSEQHVQTAHALARALNGEVACTRPVAEGLGWMPKSRYLGVTGAVITPKTYLALGVSGQVQHMVGVNGAETIVAINKDSKAPIFERCDLGLVADIEQVLPSLVEELG